jgi:hypothetical protein
MLMGSCSHLLQGGGLGLLEEEAGGLDAVMHSGGLNLSVLSLLVDGLELSMKGSRFSAVRHGDRTGQRTGSDMNSVT